jgi:hypothetical protein
VDVVPNDIAQLGAVTVALAFLGLTPGPPRMNSVQKRGQYRLC